MRQVFPPSPVRYALSRVSNHPWALSVKMHTMNEGFTLSHLNPLPTVSAICRVQNYRLLSRRFASLAVSTRSPSFTLAGKLNRPQIGKLALGPAELLEGGYT